MAEYVNPDVLISDEELEAKLGDPSIQVIEVDEDTTLYGKGHLPGAIAWNWKPELQEPPRHTSRRSRHRCPVTSPGPPTSRGARLRPRTAPSAPPTSSRSSTRTPASAGTGRSSPTAGSASARRTRGSSSPSFSATTTSR